MIQYNPKITNSATPTDRDDRYPAQDVTAPDTPRSHPSGRGRIGVRAVFGVVMVVTLTGCELLGLIIQGFSSQEIEALYQLNDRPTLVLVDDPSYSLGDPGLPNDIANRIGFHLVQNSILKEENVVPPQRLYDLAARLGHDFAKTPIDQLGKELGAQQVIYVFIESVSYGQEPGLFRPKAGAQLKLIDTVNGKQLFPLSTDETAFAPGHYPILISMFYRSDTGFGSEASHNVRRLLAQRIARDAARVFHDYLPRQPGEKFDD